MAEQASNGGGVDAQSPPPSASFPLNPEDFDGDERISFSKLDNKFVLVQSDGSEFEFDEALRRWIPVLDEALLEEQRRAYVVAGVDEEEPVEAARKKRKKEYVNGEDVSFLFSSILCVWMGEGRGWMCALLGIWDLGGRVLLILTALG